MEESLIRTNDQRFPVCRVAEGLALSQSWVGGRPVTRRMGRRHFSSGGAGGAARDDDDGWGEARRDSEGTSCEGEALL